MKPERMGEPGEYEGLARYPLLDALRDRRSRRFGMGMKIGASASCWREPDEKAAGIPAPSEAAIEATVAYCEYVADRYGRFPAYSAPFRTVLGHQATHVDVDFYDRFYHPDALSETQRQHMDRWHEP